MRGRKKRERRSRRVVGLRVGFSDEEGERRRMLRRLAKRKR